MPNKHIQNRQYIGNAKESVIEYLVSIKVAIVIQMDVYISMSCEEFSYQVKWRKYNYWKQQGSKEVISWGQDRELEST